MTGYQIVSEALLYTSKDLTLNLSDFESGKVNSLFITGYLGSGKTITGQQLAKKYKATYIELDTYREKETDKLVEKYGGEEKAKDKDIYGMVFAALEKKIKQGRERLVLEGIDVLFIDRKLVLSKAVIIKGTGLAKATWRAWVRNIKYKKYVDWYRNRTNIGIMWDTAKTQAHFEKHLRKFIKDVKARV